MRQGRDVDPADAGEPLDLAINNVASGQEGVVGRGQLVALGLTRHDIDGRIGRGSLTVIHRGVYAVGHRALTKRSHLVAAVLATGPDAALSHRTAGEFWGIRGSYWRIEVTSPRARKQRDGLVLHRSSLPEDEIEVRHGLRVTSPARTILDLAAVLTPEQTRRAFEQAEILHLASRTPLAELIQRYPTRRGTAVVRRLLASAMTARVTKRELEERFLIAVRNAGLPDPLTNVVVEGFEVDCFWPAARLVVELDSRAYHENPVAFERDRERDRKLTLAGYRPMRVTWRQLDEGVRDVAQLIRSSPV